MVNVQYSSRRWIRVGWVQLIHSLAMPAAPLSSSSSSSSLFSSSSIMFSFFLQNSFMIVTRQDVAARSGMTLTILCFQRVPSFIWQIYRQIFDTNCKYRRYMLRFPQFTDVPTWRHGLHKFHLHCLDLITGHF